MSCPAENYSNINFNEHEKARNEVLLNWRCLLVTEKQREHRKTAFKTLQQFLAWRVSEGRWNTITVYYGYFNANFNNFFKFQTQIFQ